jgi:melibiose permease/lactose/raffinose/galactose permease
MFAVVLIYTNVPSIFAGFGITNQRDAYFIFAIIVVLLMWGFQLFTLLGVKEDRRSLGKGDHTSLKEMFSVLIKNDQLMVAAVAMALFMIGYCTTTGFGVHYFKYAYKDEGMYMVFAAVLAVAQLTALVVFPLFRKKFTRKQLYVGSTIAVVIAYLVFFLSFEKLALVVIAGLVLFFAQAFIQLLTLLFLADAVEYGEWKLGKRNESVSFAVQPFVNQVGSAIGTGVLGFTLIVSGINDISEKVANAATEAEANLLIAATPDSAIWIMKLAMMIFPLICIVAGFIIYMKKFKIDETTYAKIVEDLEARNSLSESKDGVADSEVVIDEVHS